MVHSVGEEVGVDEDLVGRLKSSIVLKEHAARHLGSRYTASVIGVAMFEGVDTYTSRINSSRFFFACSSALFLSMFFFKRASLCPMMRLTVANLRVFFCTPILSRCKQSPLNERVDGL